MTNRDAYLGFSLLDGFGPARVKLLIEYFGTACLAWNAKREDLLKTGLMLKLIENLIIFRQKFSPEKYLEMCLQKEIQVFTQADSQYPITLKHIFDPPLVLYVRGVWPQDLSRSIAIVGTRKVTSYGQQITKMLTADLVLQKCLIVSGLARGVDSISHRTTLDNGGITIAVLGCGVDIIYPPENKGLYTEIIQKGGSIISEVAPGHLVSRGLFPARNRIISALSLATVVTEGAEDSGSLITARLALEQGKDVFAVPGPITNDLSKGPILLIKNGAKVVTSATDILEDLGLGFKKIKNVKFLAEKLQNLNLGRDEKLIVDLLAKGEIHYDDIVVQSQMSTAKVGSLLSVLELSGIIQSLGKGIYSLS